MLFTLVAVADCSHHIVLLAGHAGSHLAQEGRIVSCSLAGRHIPADHIAAEAAGNPAAGSCPGHIHPVEGMGCVPAVGTVAAGRSLGYIDHIQTYLFV